MKDVTEILSRTNYASSEQVLIAQIGQKLQSLWYTDTISTAPNAIKLEPASAAKTTEASIPSVKSIQENIAWLWNMVWRTSSGSDSRIDNLSVVSEQVDEKTRKLFADQLLAMQQHIQKLDEEYQELLRDNQDPERVLIKLLALLVKNQLRLKEEQSFLSTRKVVSHQKEVKEAADASQKIHAEQESLTRSQKIARVTATVLGTAAGIVALTTFAAGILTAGGFMAVGSATLASTAKVGAIGLNVASGATGLLRDYLSGKLDTTKREALLQQAKKELEQDGVSTSIGNIKASVQEIATMWTMLKEVAERHNEASKFITRG